MLRYSIILSYVCDTGIYCIDQLCTSWCVMLQVESIFETHAYIACDQLCTSWCVVLQVESIFERTITPEEQEAEDKANESTLSSEQLLDLYRLYYVSHIRNIGRVVPMATSVSITFYNRYQEHKQNASSVLINGGNLTVVG